MDKIISDIKLQEKIGFNPHLGQQGILQTGARDIAICAGRRWGKALYIYTPILTVDGFKDIKDIEVGDIVFGKDGQETKVIRTTDTMYNHNCYEVVFSDNTKIIADGEHLWEVENKKYRKNKSRNKNTISSLKIKNTEQLLLDYKATRKDGRIESNYSIKNTEPVNFQKKELLIKPYTLGCWLGDGTSAGNGFTTADEEILNHIKKDGFIISKLKGEYAYSIKTRFKKKVLKFCYLLRKLSVLNNKHIPDEYLFSSEEQRLELLKGLMDTDGYCKDNGNLEYCGTSERLCENVNFIINSLGIKTGFYKYDCFLYGKYVGKKYRIGFTTGENVFKLKRKSKRQIKSHKPDIYRRFIRVINKIDSVPVRCIEVDNKDKLYLAGKQLVPTHNSAICAYIALKTLLQDNKRIWIVAPTYDLTQKVFDYLVRWFVKVAPSQSQGISYRPFPKIRTAKGSWVECKSAENPTGLLGEELDLRIVDECSRIARRVEETYLFPTTASRKGRSFYISTPFGQNWFYEKTRSCKNSEDGAYFHFKSKDNPFFPIEEWVRAREKLPAQVFAQEYEASFLPDAAAVFRGIDEIIKDNAESDVMIGHRYIMGVDLGKHEDFTVLTIIDKWNNNVVYWDRFKQIDYPFQKSRIKATALRYNNARIIVDSTGVGDPIKDDLSREGLFVDDFKFTNKSKKELVEKLSIFIEQKNVWIPPIEILIDELKSFGYHLTDAGNVIYRAPQGQHDDAVVSLALAVWGLTGSAKPKTAIQMELAKSRLRKKNQNFI